MKNRYFLLSALAAAAVMPGTASANLLLDLPPILAGNSSSTCNECNACDPTCINPCTKCTGTCCAGQCHPVAENEFCCADTWQTTGYCCNGTYSTEQCPSSATGKLNDTGIIWSGTASSNGSACNDASQDCSYGWDNAEPDSANGHAGFKFTKLNSSGAVTSGSTWDCVKDERTGLTWEVKTTTTKNWANAKTYAGTFSACGIAAGSWRLPTLKELLSVVSYNDIVIGTTSGPTIDTAYFPNVLSKNYWSGTATVGGNTAWGVTFYDGSTSKLDDQSLNVMLVSGDSTPVNPRFTTNTAGDEVTDNQTGLIWKKCLQGLSGTNCDQGAATTVTWVDALALTANGWRLPNIKELQSIVDETKSNPAISTDFPNSNYTVWSSSPYSESFVISGATRYKSWGAAFSTGIIGSYFRDTSLLGVRLVKDAPAN